MSYRQVNFSRVHTNIGLAQVFEGDSRDVGWPAGAAHQKCRHQHVTGFLGLPVHDIVAGSPTEDGGDVLGLRNMRQSL